MTFNHKPFIIDTLNGFCMQKTSFPYVSIIIDDASTDGTMNAINEFINSNCIILNTTFDESGKTGDYLFSFAKHKTNHNCFFAIYHLNHNHYHIGESKTGYTDKWTNISDYIAICEGDDFWTSPDKLQRQVSFLEKHPSYSMTCSRALLFSIRKKKIIGENYCYYKSRRVSSKDVIFRTGLFISTCSIVYKKEVSANMPDYWRNCIIGDYPLQIACALNGNVWYDNEAMSVYRIDNSSSWMGVQNWGSGSDPRIYQLIDSSIRMFDGFGKDYPKYRKLFKNKIAEEINRNVPSTRVGYQELEAFLDHYSKEIKDYSLRWKIDLFFRKCRIPYVRIIYEHFFASYYQPKNKWYKD